MSAFENLGQGYGRDRRPVPVLSQTYSGQRYPPLSVVLPTSPHGKDGVDGMGLAAGISLPLGFKIGLTVAASSVNGLQCCVVNLNEPENGEKHHMQQIIDPGGLTHSQRPSSTFFEKLASGMESFSASMAGNTFLRNGGAVHRTWNEWMK